MIKKTIYVITACMLVMLLIPALLQYFLEQEDSMYYNFMLLMTAFPILSAGVGVFAGVEFGKRWGLLFVAPSVFLLAALLLFAPWVNEYFVYIGIYALLGVLGAGIVPMYRYLKAKILK